MAVISLERNGCYFMAIIGSLFFPSAPPQEILWDLENALLPGQILKEVLGILVGFALKLYGFKCLNMYWTILTGTSVDASRVQLESCTRDWSAMQAAAFLSCCDWPAFVIWWKADE